MKGIIFLAYFLVLIPCYGQKFDWCQDGFKSSVNTYSNIDNSGINLEITGIYSSSRSCMNNEPYIYTGINNSGSSGVVHNYEISFSEYVDVEFTVYDINADTTSGFRYFDYLVFSSSPSISSNSPSLIIKGDTVLPKTGNSIGPEVKVNYKNVKKFSIQHGLGKRYNPGYILISSLIINDDKLGKPILFSKVADSELVAFKQNTSVRNAYFFASTGQLINAKYNSEKSGTTRIATSGLAAGIYFVYVEFESGHVLKEKFMVIH